MSYCGRRSGIELSVERVDIECDFDTRGVRGLADVERPFRCVCMSGKIKSDATAVELDRLRVAYGCISRFLVKSVSCLCTSSDFGVG